MLRVSHLDASRFDASNVDASNVQIFRDSLYREFHLSRAAREIYAVDGLLFASSGNILLADFGAARRLSQKMNERRDAAHFPERAVKAAHINAMGLLDEVLHFVVARYCEERNPRALELALSHLDAQIGAQNVSATLLKFNEEFPPLAVHRGEISAIEYSLGETGGVANRQIALEEMLMLWLSNQNAALKPFAELFDDAPLNSTVYAPIMNEIRAFFETQPKFGPDNLNLIEMLRAPALANPTSIAAQLEWILAQWGNLAPSFLVRILGGLDFIREDEKAGFFGPGPSFVPVYDGAANALSSTQSALAAGMDEPERFSDDREWMPRAVLMAKNAYVWRDQLSKKYGREIRTLHQIPDEELDTLAAQGFTGLWLIGLWERSTASQKIKQMCGNPDAVASAYSLYDYEIAHDLGGPEAMHNLRERAGSRGLCMASDMVPNHMAIDSRWVVEHPDWFLSLEAPPFPTYTFDGPDLSNDARVGIFLEDHYYTKNDAAVVFKRVDKQNGETRYIYHGNDGTLMPWNDTAQLNYLRADVREAVIQTILHVARQFPIIRFDAAMTLAKRHYQRLWFPLPGSGGDIPSRAEHSLSTQSFNELFPEEFWREVVDRVAQEVPDTLLLAEAFWMMESYFVRTLGMHRVYNSAFMNMMRDEENLKYRLVLKNTLEFDPDILKRYVNFMNNPDEDTAVEQFGKDGKYFGVCTMMATLPGLPMFGHGQLEGFAEKYGMEYQRAYWNETPDAELLRRHEREIFPLLKRRYLFAEAANFLLYDFWTGDGGVNEDVFAYSNRHENERALVVFHNKYSDAAGWIRMSVGSARKSSDGRKSIEQKTLGEGLSLQHDAEYFTIFRDNVTDLEYIRASRDLCERGLYIELGAYECHVFLDFREVADDFGRHYEKLTTSLNGRGVTSIDIALLELALAPVHAPFAALVNADLLQRLMNSQNENHRSGISRAADLNTLLDEVESCVRVLVRAIRTHNGALMELPPDGKTTEDIVAQEVRDAVEKTLHLARFVEISNAPQIDQDEENLTEEDALVEELAKIIGLSRPFVPTDSNLNGEKSDADKAANFLKFQAKYLTSQLDAANWGALLGWSMLKTLGRAAHSTTGFTTIEYSKDDDENLTAQSRAALDELRVTPLLVAALRKLSETENEISAHENAEHETENSSILIARDEVSGTKIENVEFAKTEISDVENAANASEIPEIVAVESAQEKVERAVAALKILTHLGAHFPLQSAEGLRELVKFGLKDEETRRFLGVNLYDEIWWFNRERFELFLWFAVAANFAVLGRDDETMERIYGEIFLLKLRAMASDFQVAKFEKRLDER